jgi:hypothetical protein
MTRRNPMASTALYRSLSRAAAMLAVMLLFVPGAPAADDAIPENLRYGIETALKKELGALAAEKDAKGASFKRGTYSEAFKPGEEGTYLVSFHVDTISQAPEGLGRRMKTERFVYTMKPSGNEWVIADKTLKDTYEGLWSIGFGPSEFYEFDRISFDREGLKVTGGKGALYLFQMAGKTAGYRLVADGLSFRYDPPTDAAPYYMAKWDRILREKEKEFVFTPLWFDIDCDPMSCAEIEQGFDGFRKLAGGRDAAPAKLQEIFDEQFEDVEESRQKNPFGGFGREYRDDRSFWQTTIRRDGGKEHSLFMRFDSWEHKEVGFFASGFGFAPLFTYNSEAVRQSGASPYDLELREDADARWYNLQGVNGIVELALNDPTELVGDVTFKLRVKRDTRELPFRISRTSVPSDSKEVKNPKLFVNSIQDGTGNELTWVKVGGFSGLVVFPETLKAGQVVSLRMRFRNLDSIYYLNPTYSAMDRGGWLPFVARFGDMIDEFNLTVRSPARFFVLGIGKKVSDEINADVRTTRWTSSSPVSFPTIIFGEYEMDGTDYQEKPAHLATKLDGSPIPVNVYVDKTSMQGINTKFSREVDVRDTIAAQESGARDIRGKQLNAIAVQASVALDIYKEIFGVDYPYQKLDLVADPLGAFYGQAPASIIYLGFGVFRGEGALIADSNLSKFNKDVVAHEVAHQWWGSSTANLNQGNYWFIESLAEMSSALYVERVYGKQRYLEKVADWRSNILDNELFASVQTNYTEWAGESGFGSVQANIYNKGPYAFHMLRELGGEEKFFEFLGKLAQTMKGEEIVTRDIQQTMEEVYGGNMEWFFDQWIRGVGVPEFSLHWAKRKTEDGKWLVEGVIKQRVVAGKYKQELPGVYYTTAAPITFVTYDGKEFKTPNIGVKGAETKFGPLKVPEEPVQVVFNKNGEILAHDLLVNRDW